MVGKTYGFYYKGVWGMGYCRPMGYGMQFPVNQVGGQLRLWGIRGYGLLGVWVMRGLTVLGFPIRVGSFNAESTTPLFYRKSLET